MTEREKLEAKVRIAKYAESQNMLLLCDYGEWIAIGFEKTNNLDDEEAAKRHIANVIKEAKNKRSIHAK